VSRNYTDLELIELKTENEEVRRIRVI